MIGFEHDELELAGIPVTVVRIPSPEARPLVVFSNGMGSWRQQAVPPGVPQNPISPPLVAGLLDAGYDIAVPELPAHGDRAHPRLRPAVRIALGFLGRETELLQTAVEETPGFIDALIREGVARDPRRIAAVGHSWGGLHTMLRFAADLRIRTAVALIPVVDPTCLEPFAELGSSPGLTGWDLADRLARTLDGRALLLVAGADDVVAPSALADETTRRITAAIPGARVEFRSIQGVGHSYDPAMLALTAGWLEAHVRD